MRKSKKIPFERPVTDITTLAIFKESVAKARLVYEYVECVEKKQFAVLYNRTEEGRQKDAVVMYTSEFDKKVHTRELNYYMVGIEPEIDEEKGIIFAQNELPPDSSYRSVNGLLAHNGRVIVPVKYSIIQNVADCFVIGNMWGRPRRKDRLLDYEGNVYIETAGNLGVSSYTIKNDKDEISVVTEAISDGVENPQLLIYIVYKGDLYFVKRFETEKNGYSATWYVRDDGVVITDFEKEIIVTIKEMLEKKQKITKEAPILCSSTLKNLE